MSRLNNAKGNMYDWVTHTWSPIKGCPHQCSYCYVRKFADLPETVTLDLPFPDLGQGKTIFVAHMGDLFAEAVPEKMIDEVMAHCAKYPGNTYVFQTKNPGRILECQVPANSIIGTTIETNRDELLQKISTAPSVKNRANALRDLRHFYGKKTFLTVEPIMAFDLPELRMLIELANPGFINIGADSKGHGLPEPMATETIFLIEDLKVHGFDVRLKPNLARIIGKEQL